MSSNRRDRRREAAIAKLAQETMHRMERGEHEYGDATVDAEYRAKMIAICQTIDEFVNDGVKGHDRKTAFVVMMFPFGAGPGRTNFMSNGVDRKDLVVLMKEMIARFEGQPEVDAGTIQ